MQRKCLQQLLLQLQEITDRNDGPVLEIDVSHIDFVSNVRHLIAVYEGIERLPVPREFRG